MFDVRIMFGLAAFPILLSCQAADDTLPQRDVSNAVSTVTKQAVDNQIFVPGGTFAMGDFGAVGEDGVWRPYFPPTAEVDVAHDVKLSDYSIAKYETTWFEFDTFLPATGRTAYLLVNGERLPRSLYNKNSEDWGYVAHPAETTWQDAKAYCAWLAEETGRDFDLPTSAQWDSQREIAGARTGFTPHMTESR